MRKIVVDLGNPGKALAELRAFKEEVIAKTKELVVVLCQNGVSIASDKIISYDAIDTGDLDSSIYYAVSADGTKGVIRTDSDHAIYVEFGTGTCVDRKGSGKHPKAQEFGYQYDVNKHGEDGWYYFDQNQNRVRWTKGMRSRPFMFETSVELIDNLENTAKEVFGR